MNPQYILSGFAGLLLIAITVLQIGIFRGFGSAEPETMGFILTKENAGQPVLLSKEQHEEAVRQCVVAFHSEAKDSGIIHLGKPEDVARSLAAFAEKSCNCLVSQLQKRTTTLEFVQAMAMQFAFMPREDFASFSSGLPKKRLRVLPAAERIGISTKEFDAAGANNGRAIMASGEACMGSTTN